MSFGGAEIFDGVPASEITPEDWSVGRWVNSSAGWLTYPWDEFNATSSATAYSEDSGLGGLFATFVPIGLVFAFWRGYSGTRRDRAWIRISLVLWVTLGVLWWFGLQQLIRFGLPWIVLTILLASPLLEYLEQAQPRKVLVLFAAATIVTSCLLVLDPLSRLGVRVRYERWTRAEQYKISGFIDTLPEGSVILNLSPLQNFRLAGADLGNRVVFDFEAPKPLPSSFVRDREIEYVFTLETLGDPSPPLPELRLVHRREFVHAVDGQVRTELFWKFEPVDPLR